MFQSLLYVFYAERLTVMVIKLLFW